MVNEIKHLDNGDFEVMPTEEIVKIKAPITKGEFKTKEVTCKNKKMQSKIKNLGILALILLATPVCLSIMSLFINTDLVASFFVGVIVDLVALGVAFLAVLVGSILLSED